MLWEKELGFVLASASAVCVFFLGGTMPARSIRLRFSAAVASFLAVLSLVLCLYAERGAAQESGQEAKRRQDGLELLLLHTNDLHSYLAGRDAQGNACLQSEGCTGGLARLATAINRARADHDNVLVLDAGDQFQGTLFFTVNKWPMLSDINALLRYDAMTLGNHEFDDGCEAAADFVRAQPYPVLAANLDARPGCPLRDAPVLPWIIKEVRGVRVGIVGLANPSVRTLSSACPETRFTRSADTLKKAVTALQRQGVRHIIALTHLGLPKDVELARNVDGVDIIVGGHTHTYLGPGSDAGPYPLVEHSPSGQPVLVVTAGALAKYLGELDVTFDAEGVPLRWNGAARPLDASVPPDPAMEAKIAKYTRRLEAFTSVPVGVNGLEFRDGLHACRRGECLAGMVVTDSMLDYGRAHGAQIALINSGGLRAPLRRGTLSLGDMLAVLPFGNRVIIRDFSGGQLLAALEHGVADHKGVGSPLLQVAGMRYAYAPARPSGNRIVMAEMVDKYGGAHPVTPQGRYRVALVDYLERRGDGYAMLAKGVPVEAPDPADVDILTAYIKAHSPLPMPAAGRITRIGASGAD